MDLQTVRDWVIIVYGVFGIITFLIISAVTALIGLAVLRLLGAVNSTVEDRVGPAIDSVRDTAKSVRGATDFIADTVARPVIRTYGIVAGVRRGIAVFSGLRRPRAGK